MKILIIEDEARLAESVSCLLNRDGFVTETAADGLSGYRMAAKGGYDALILDVMLPGMDGFQVLRRLREAGNDVPVLMLTARAELQDRLKGLNTGADYYLTKPFENQELLACLHTILRRSGGTVSDTLTFGDLTLNCALSTLSRGETGIPLSAKELKLLQVLIQNRGQLLSKEQLLDKVWGYDAEVNINSVEAYLSFLRKKLSFLGSGVRITVARNLGYRLEEPEA